MAIFWPYRGPKNTRGRFGGRVWVADGGLSQENSGRRRSGRLERLLNLILDNRLSLDARPLPGRAAGFYRWGTTYKEFQCRGGRGSLAGPARSAEAAPRRRAAPSRSGWCRRRGTAVGA